MLLTLKKLVKRGLLAAAIVTMNSSPALAQDAPNITPLTPAQPEESIDEFQITPDNQHVVYIATDPVVGNQVLFRAPLAGGTPQSLTPLTNPNRRVFDFQISPDGRFVIYRGRILSDDITELFKVPINGGESVRLSSPSDRRNVRNLILSNDGKFAVYQVPTNQLSRDRLFSVAIDGGNLVELSENLSNSLGPSIVKIDPTSQRVVFTARVSNFSLRGLFSVPIDSTSLTTLFREDRVAFHIGSQFVFSPDGAFVAFGVGANTFQAAQQVFTVPVDQPNGVKAISEFFNDGVIFDFLVSRDGRNIFLQGRLNPGPVQLFRLPFDGSAAPQLISQAFASDRIGVRGLSLSPDGEKVLYRADPRLRNVLGLFSLDITSGDLVELFAAQSDDLEVEDFRVSLDGRQAVFQLKDSTGSPTQFQLFRVPLSRGDAMPISPVLPEFDEEGPAEYAISPNGKIAVFRAPDASRLFATSLQEPEQSNEELCFPIVTQNQKVAVVCL